MANTPFNAMDLPVPRLGANEIAPDKVDRFIKFAENQNLKVSLIMPGRYKPQGKDGDLVLAGLCVILTN